MKRFTAAVTLAAAVALGAAAGKTAPATGVHTHVGGYIGDRINSCIDTRVKGQDVDHLTEPFTHKADTATWATEFWGKWVQGAINSYRYTHDPQLYDMIARSVGQIIDTQQPDGYIGNYAPEAHLKQWDVWGRKYTCLGLLDWYRLTGDRKALDAAARLIDHLMTEVGPGLVEMETVGNYHGMAASSVLEPVVYLYQFTSDPRYLDYARYIVGRFESPEGCKLVTKAIEGTDVASRFPHPGDWFSPENGQKAYEMMSCYVGLLELYRLTGNRAWLDAIERTAANIIDREINVAGSGSSFECWYHGRDYQHVPTYHTMETCVTFTWMQLCDKLLELTGKPVYADQIERTLYNALMASLKGDGSEIAKYSPLEGHRFEGEEQCGLHINCCNANGPRAFALVPQVAVKTPSADRIDINLYGDIDADVTLAGMPVKVSQQSAYPVGETSVITIDPAKAREFTVALRIPLWSTATRVSVNGAPVNDVAPGTYLPITRRWAKGDKVEVAFDMPVRLEKQAHMQAVTRGPVVFARDSRFGDGFVDETTVIDATPEGIIEGASLTAAPGWAWMALDVPVTAGSNLEGTDAERSVRLCDFASAGNTWAPDVRYRVWLPETLNIKLKRIYE